MSLGRSWPAAGAGAASEPGVQIAEPPRAASGVQISPGRRDAQVAGGGGDPRAVLGDQLVEDPHVEQDLAGVLRVDDRPDQPHLHQAIEHGGGGVLVAAVALEQDDDGGDPDLGPVEDGADLELESAPIPGCAGVGSERLGLPAAADPLLGLVAVVPAGRVERQAAVEVERVDPGAGRRARAARR